MALDQQDALAPIESTYVKKVLGEPLHHGLCALLLYQPKDPIDFLANYLRYWVKHVRLYRRIKIAEKQIDLLLAVQIPWNVGIIAEQAKRMEQDTLDAARRIAEEEARLALIEKTRIKQATETAARKVTDQIRRDVAGGVWEDVAEQAEDQAVKKAEQLEKERLRAEEAAKRRALEEEEQMGREGEEEEEEEDAEEDEEEAD